MNSETFRKWLAENPVVITGLGVHTVAGDSVEALWTQVCAGVSPAAWLPPMVSGASRHAGCVAPPVKIPTEEARIFNRMDRCTQLALAAARHAWASARVDADAWPAERIGIVAGTSRGPVDKWTESLERLAKGRMLPTLAANSTIASLSGALSVSSRVQGPCLTVSSACSSAASAIALGAQQIVTGAADIMLVGGAESPLNANILAQLSAAGVLGSHDDPRQTCRPFDTSRNGTVLGEGAAFLVLESLRAAQQRKAVPIARLAGWALRSEGTERTGMSADGEGLYRTMTQALELAGLTPAQIDYINAHGTGTPLNDQMELQAMARVFGPAGRPVPCSSTKPVTGHCMGAVAAIEAVIAIEALKHQHAPPTANCREPEAHPGLELVQGAAKACRLKAIMSNSSGFWGAHASLIFTSVENL